MNTVALFWSICRYYANQKKTLEVNPRHPLVKELLKRVETDKEDKTAKDLARVLFETATLRSGFMIKVKVDNKEQNPLCPLDAEE